jgi:MFS family permease
MRAVLAEHQIDRATMFTILVAALGYMVDIFDLLLFSIVRVQSLQSLGVPEDQILSQGIFLINTQMAGLLIGGIVWGVWGDKMGRVSVLFGSILMYSLANIANGFVTDVETYAALRLIAGIGLAGELGAGVTLASELFPRALRGLGTTFIAATGMIGAILAAVIADLTDWRTAYIIGGVMGLALLALRLQVRESGMFEKLKQDQATRKERGNFLMLLTNRDRFKRYLCVILVGSPLWCVVGLFITFTPEFARDMGMTTLPKAGMAVLSCYAGLIFGDIASGVLSQYLRSRRKAVGVFLCLTIIFTGAYALVPHDSIAVYYSLCFLIGIGVGYWAMFIQMGAEQFGTNIRATAATSIPNMVRGLTIPITAGFHALIPVTGVLGAGLCILAVTLTMAFIALSLLKETFDADLDYVEA